MVVSSAKARVRWSPIPKLDRIEALVIASGALLFIPGARTLWAWPWLWFVPGWFFARRVLGVRGGLLLIALSLVSSIAFASVVCLPLTVLMGGPRPWIVFLSIAAFALACGCRRPKGEPALPAVPWPPLPTRILVAGFVVFRIVVAVAQSGRTSANPDDWYLAGIVRELAAVFPPSSPIAATSVLKQPWGYWLLYSLTQLVSQLSVPVTIQIASLLLALAFVATLHVLVTTVSGDRRAGGFAVALALGASELLWVEEILRPTTERLTWQVQGITSFPVNLVRAFYDVPVLIVALAVLYFLASRRFALAALFASVAPFFHPVHASVLFGVVALAFAFEAGQRRLTFAHAWLLAAPVPFFLLFVLLYAHGLPSHLPFVPRLSESGTHLQWWLRWAGFYVPLAIAGALRRDVQARPLLVLLFVTTSALSIFTFVANYHWSTDLLMVSMFVLGGIALSALVERRGRLGAALALAIVVTAIGAADYPALFSTTTDRRTAEERAAGRWLQDNTTARAVIAVDHRSMPATATALELGQRRLLLGPTYQVANTATEAELAALGRANLASLRDPCEARKQVDYVLFERRGAEPDALAAWRSVGAPAYENAEMTIYATSSVKSCP